ncbi:hypothetical protein DYBT9275_00378 [Dyadobacter sp. CECT 9275]|uniref:Uncharacterized protein n=1 Tax=Dyadobacter helix TaxID=2822344 RepID=A0A916N2E9_9BACT|nr:hypothetical protein DYBT9275_00378 [Dyadobacter sp. CECT 9275]
MLREIKNFVCGLHTTTPISMTTKQKIPDLLADSYL